jgi:hypothetical protein
MPQPQVGVIPEPSPNVPCLILFIRKPAIRGYGYDLP